MAVGRYLATSVTVRMKKGLEEISWCLGVPMQGWRQGNRMAGERRPAQLHSICIHFLKRGDHKKWPQGTFTINVFFTLEGTRPDDLGIILETREEQGRGRDGQLVNMDYKWGGRRDLPFMFHFLRTFLEVQLAFAWKLSSVFWLMFIN